MNAVIIPPLTTWNVAGKKVAIVQLLGKMIPSRGWDADQLYFNNEQVSLLLHWRLHAISSLLFWPWYYTTVIAHMVLVSVLSLIMCNNEGNR